MTNNNETNNFPVETGVNRKFFKELVEANLPQDTIKEKLGDLDKEWKNDTVGEVLEKGDKEKLTDYEKLEVKDLPTDWKNRLILCKELEKNQVDYNQKKEELKGWVDAFGEQKPSEVQEKITKLEEEYSEFKKKSEAEIQELTKKYELADNELKGWQQEFPQQTSVAIQEKIKELENKLAEWTQIFGNRELEEFKEEWEELKKRPDITITEDQFWDDYSARQPLEVSKLEAEKLTKEQEKVTELREKNRKLFGAINNYLKAERTKRYVLAKLNKPALTIKEARQAIVDLLEETEQRWSDYLDSNQENITNQKNELGLSFYEEEKEQRARQVLAWITEAKTTLDYEKLFERWSGSKEYNEANDYDGSLYLLGDLLKVKDFETPVLKAKEEGAL